MNSDAPPDVQRGPAPGEPAELTDSLTIPLIHETLNVQKRRVEKGGYRITKTVGQREEVVDEAFTREDVSIERVPMNEIVSHASPPQVRYEGDTMVIPVVEEVLVVEKRLVLKEEIRVRRKTEEYRAPQRVILRSDNVVLERIDEQGTTLGPPDSSGRDPSSNST